MTSSQITNQSKVENLSQEEVTHYPDNLITE